MEPALSPVCCLEGEAVWWQMICEGMYLHPVRENPERETFLSVLFLLSDVFTVSSVSRSRSSRSTFHNEKCLFPSLLSLFFSMLLQWQNCS